MDDRIATSLHTGLLIAVVGAVAWATGLPALFPSLGPSAFVLATFPESEASDPRRVVGSHAIGVAAGLAAYHLVASGIVVTGQIAPLSLVGLRLAVSGVGAIVLTVAGMLSFGVRHPPACATTLIVALGLLPTFFEGALIVAAVAVLLAVQRAVLLTNGLTERVGVVGGRSESE
jgi:CBS-domain-containing membrane protein